MGSKAGDNSIPHNTDSTMRSFAILLTLTTSVVAGLIGYSVGRV